MASSRVPDVVNAAVDALESDVELSTLGVTKSATHVPKGTDPPYNLVIGGDEIPWLPTFVEDSLDSPGETDSGDSGGRQVDVVVQCFSTYRGSTQVDDIASRVMEVLTDEDNWSAVDGFQLAEFMRNLASPPADLFNDGVVWFIRTVTVRVSLV